MAIKEYDPNWFLRLIGFLLCLLSGSMPAQVQTSLPLHNNQITVKTMVLQDNWLFRKYGDAEWLPAVIPGCVHEDLLRNGKIPDPYMGTNETAVQWVEHEEWEYANTFTVTNEFLARHKNIDAVFDGLDTYADVYLNGTKILSADNMFRKWVVPVRQVLLQGTNQLLCRFYPPLKINLPKLYELPYSLPAANDAHTYKVSVFSRKPPYHFGWDWGPRLVTCGLRSPVALHGWNEAKITAVQILQPNVTAERASLIARVHVAADKAIGPVTLSVAGYADTTLQLHEGAQVYDIPFTIEKPRLWFPIGYGGQELYPFTVTLLHDGGMTDSTTIVTGLRTIRLVQEKDTRGESYYFTVNGIPVFAKGADYIPQDNMVGRVTPARYQKLINDVCDANMNMLRVWGGGYYENELFYRLCDERGILVWQDFMFACSMYPGDADFLRSVSEEAREQVIRLSNHPSVALWCGNNEVDVAWKNWGWQEQFMFSAKDSAKIKQDYDTIFKCILKDAVAENDIQKAYVHTTPLSNWGKPEFFKSGSMHYWGVWHGDEPFSAFKNNVPRFMAEYGFQSFPTMPAIKKFASGDELSVTSETMKLHQKSYKGNKSILKYLEPLFGSPKSFASFVYLSHLTQAEGIAYAIRCHRLAKGYCMGTLFWQLDDSWFGPSWSAIDYSGRKKALYYFTREMYKPVMAILEQGGDKLTVSAVSDSLQALNVRAHVELIDFTGKVYYQHTVEQTIENAHAVLLHSVNALKLLPLLARNHAFARVRLFSGNELLDEQKFYFAIPKKMKLPKPLYTCKYDSLALTVTIKAETFIKNLCLETETDGVDFSDNYFDMLPGEQKTIRVSGCKKLPVMHYYSLYEALKTSK